MPVPKKTYHLLSLLFKIICGNSKEENILYIISSLSFKIVYIYTHTHIYIGNSKEESIYNILFQVYYLKVLCVYIKRSVFSLGPPGIAGIGTILTVDRVQHCYFLSEKAEV